MILQSIIEQQAAYVCASGYTVAINYGMEWVDIYGDASIHLQGEEAREYIQQLRQYEDNPELEDCTRDTLALALAMPYIDSLL